MSMVNDTEYAEFMAWKRKRAAEQAEIERRQKVKQLQREQHEDWERNRRIDAALMDGVQNGLTWGEFLRYTSCPGDLEQRYLQLQQQSGIAPGSKIKQQEDKAFLDGFQKG